ncbi:L-arabinolactonase [Labrenzia sp. THAF35]|uniref:SMP-30/gluconolactonase/LRE family protein n=1 Tax=Labrenzia sp. THAF35 TaxID=2587854 RepID=UPI0012683505|nr:SMP-30/gluconolactonase/LRE family protein [Labrenzia sp. THAF35]MEC9418965.1 SMP-30/gluconolactonase/LRE family protein [Pseudomonadota bacterium]QFT67902.1 L-arabinolactonase [Labrenzia sp. THAF35]
MTQTDTTSEKASPEVPGAQALVRGLDVLMTIGAAPAPMRFAELQKALDIPKGSLHRLLAALQSRELVRFEEHGKRYSLGSKVFDLARRTIDQSSVIRAAKPEIARLSRMLNRPCCLYVQDGDFVFVLYFEDPDAGNARVVRVWPRIPAATSAPGLAIAARLPHQEGSGKANPALGQSKALGYALAKDDTQSVASAMVDSSGYPVAAICCHFETSAERAEELHETGRLVKEAAQRASGNVLATGSAGNLPPKPATISAGLQVLNTGRDFMGENPVWCPVQQRLWWLDILAPALRWLDDGASQPSRVMLEDLTGGLCLTESGRLLLAGRQGIQLFAPTTGQTTLLFDPEEDKPDNRFNSAGLDQTGNLWVGTMPLDNATGNGSLYRIGADLTVDVILENAGLPKNPALSPDGKWLYLSDGRSGALCKYPLSANGTLGKRQVLVQGSTEIGLPNGIAVDIEGYIWVTMYGGWSVNRYKPDGSLDRRIDLPVPMPTALTFGGRDLKTLFVTSTYLRMPAGYSSIAPQAGNLIRIETDVVGGPAGRFGL